MLSRGSPLPSLGTRSGALLWRFVLSRWWVVALLAISVAAGGTVGTDSPPLYEAQAIATAINTPLPKEDFELAEQLFAHDEVLVPVVEGLGLAVEPKQLIGREFLIAEAQTGGALVVTGRSRDRQQAIDLANAAARSFADVLEGNNLGRFAVSDAETVSETPGAPPALRAAALAALGALLGIGLLALYYYVRQPLLSEEQAAGPFPADAFFSARVQPPRRSPFRRRAAVIAPEGLTNALLREMQRNGHEDQGPVCFVLVESRRRGDPGPRALLDDLGVDNHWSSPARDGHPFSPYWIRAEEPSTLHAMEEARVVVTLVSKGAPRVYLQEVADELLVMATEPHRILVFVRTGVPRERLGRRGRSRAAGRRAALPRTTSPSGEEEDRSTASPNED